MYAGLQATLHNAHFRGGKTPRRPYKPDEFIPSPWQPAAPLIRQTWQEQMAMLRTAFQAIGDMNKARGND